MDKNVLSDAYEAHKIHALKSVLGDDLPDWVPSGDKKLVEHAISEFIEQGFKPDELRDMVCGDAEIPVERLSPVLFEHIHYLLNVRRAMLLGERQGLPLLIGPKQTNQIVMLIRKARASKGGQGKRGKEGALKQYIREVIDDGARDYDAVLLALEEHTMVHDIKGDTLTYGTPGGVIKDVKLPTVKRYYRDITK